MTNRTWSMSGGLLAAVAALTVALGVALAACGSGSDSNAPQATTETSNGAEPSIEFEIIAEDILFVPNEVTIPAGETVSITLRNLDEVEHDLVVDGLEVELVGDERMGGEHEGALEGMLTLHTLPGETASAMFRTEQTGTFEFSCTIPGHKEAGMVGTLTVE